MSYVNPWTPARIEFVTAQWKAGYSAGQISLVMGVSRSSVIGKVHRLGLGGRGQPNQRLPKGPRHIHRVTGPRQRAEHYARSYTPPKEKFPLPVFPKGFEPVSKKLSFGELKPRQCKWPEGDGPFHFCGLPTFLNRPYCLGHCRTAYQPNEKRVRA